MSRDGGDPGDWGTIMTDDARTIRRRRRTVAAALVGVAAFVVAACAPEPPPVVPETPGGATDLQLTGTYTGFQRPWDVQFTPDGTPLVTERGGTLARVSGTGRALVATVPDVKATGEGGLLGLAVDPGFATNGWIYECHTSASVDDVRVVRHRVLPGYTGLADATPIVTGIPANGGGRHTGCRVVIGPDGDLWVTTGDAVLATAPQNRANLAGKVLRLQRDGSPDPGNPGVVNAGAGWNPKVFSYGHRNVQGLAFRPSDGAAFAVEHGTGTDDEINLLSPGANYGWNPVGPGGAYDESFPMTFAGATPPVWASGSPTIAPSGATFLRGAAWGDREGQLAVAVLKGTRLMLVGLDGATVTSVETRVTNQGRLRTAQMGPDGRLWLVQDASPGSLLALSPVAAG
jgi:aldose sugar dehydrogenase